MRELILNDSIIEMADKRKLQAEIDRCLKKVQEGCEAFEDTWQKLHSANNSNQKDKHENDLKKEIKKLQRLRDQIKTWVGSNDVKDKKVLLENRKRIERDMERFKMVERETKTKAYSKEGLGSVAKVDPAQKVKDETRHWLQLTIDTLDRQVDTFESEIESFSSNSRKKKIDRDKQERIDKVKSRLDKHCFHLTRLESLMRSLDNQTIAPDKINIIRDDIEYYVEACQEPDYEDNEFIYEDLGLDDTSCSSITSIPTSPEEKQFNSFKKSDDDTKVFDQIVFSTAVSSASSHVKEEEVKKRKKSDEISRKNSINNAHQIPTTKPFPSSSATTPPTISRQNSKVAFSSQNQVNPAVTLEHSQTGGGFPGIQRATESLLLTSSAMSIRNRSSSWVTTDSVSQSDSNNTMEIQNAVNSIVSSVASLSITINHDATPSFETGHKASSEDIAEVLTPSTTPAALSTDKTSKQSKSPLPSNGPKPPSDNVTLLKTLSEKTVATSSLEESTAIFSTCLQSTKESLSVLPAQTRPGLTTLVSQHGSSAQPTSKATGEARIQPLLGVAPLGPVLLDKAQRYKQNMLEACWRHMPQPSDSERVRHYLHRNPCQTPSYYHQSPLSQQDSMEFYLKLSTEALFFIFYYMEATKAQYMAAKALKKQSWRFHTKYMMWFQRHDEPKTITDEYEMGSYIYFDYEKWGQRKKDGFTFEYRFLEDRELQ